MPKKSSFKEASLRKQSHLWHNRRSKVGMNYDTVVSELEAEWAIGDGFFWRLRQGEFVTDQFERALRTLKAITIAEHSEVPRRVVSLLWYVPIFMHWQTERVRESNGDVAAYARAITAMTNEVE